MRCCHEFLRGSSSDIPCEPLSEAKKAIQSLPSLVFHESIKFIRECWSLISHSLRTLPSKPHVILRLALRLLVYANPSVQKHVYGILLDFCHQTLNIGTATDPKRNGESNSNPLPSTFGCSWKKWTVDRVQKVGYFCLKIILFQTDSFIDFKILNWGELI